MTRGLTKKLATFSDKEPASALCVNCMGIRVWRLSHELASYLCVTDRKGPEQSDNAWDLAYISLIPRILTNHRRHVTFLAQLSGMKKIAVLWNGEWRRMSKD